jgi:hypothetical protein
VALFQSGHLIEHDDEERDKLIFIIYPYISYISIHK